MKVMEEKGDKDEGKIMLVNLSGRRTEGKERRNGEGDCIEKGRERKEEGRKERRSHG